VIQAEPAQQIIDAEAQAGAEEATGLAEPRLEQATAIAVA
jgi:hypothetical protein